jgi:hypothetical protein
MKFISILCSVLITGLFNSQSYAQQSYRIKDVPRIFKANLASEFSKKINDSLTMHIVSKSPNYEISVVRKDGTTACSCLYSINKKSETMLTTTRTLYNDAMVTKDSATQIKNFEPIKENCILQYRTAIMKSREQ